MLPVQRDFSENCSLSDDFERQPVFRYYKECVFCRSFIIYVFLHSFMRYLLTSVCQVLADWGTLVAEYL